MNHEWQLSRKKKHTEMWTKETDITERKYSNKNWLTEEREVGTQAERNKKKNWDTACACKNIHNGMDHTVQKKKKNNIKY